MDLTKKSVIVLSIIITLGIGFGLHTILGKRLVSSNANPIIYEPSSTPELRNGRQSIVVNDVTRDFILFLPTGFKTSTVVPLLFVFHGGGGSMDSMQRITNWNSIAERENFVVVYPNALNKSWNDGRLTEDNSDKELGDDIAFVRLLNDYLTASGKINPNQVFATGVSNGGFMSQKVACDLSEKFFGIAPVATGVSELYVNNCRSTKPMPIIWFQGTEDPLIPFEGGDLIPVIGDIKSRGKVLSASDGIKFWNQRNGCEQKEQSTDIPDTNKSDDSTITLKTYCADSDAPLYYYQINGGGHTWPGGPQYYPKFFIGNVNKDINSEEIIWDFFSNINK